MAASAAVLTARTQPAAAWLRWLQLWHLLSLDAPTVAFCWLLLFAQTMLMPHALRAAAALACAVWLVYAADRLLDARDAPKSFMQGPLSRLYRTHARRFLLAASGIAAVMVCLLARLPRPLREAWVLLAIPLVLYGVAVHVLHLHGRWKALCVAIFFAVAVALPSAIQDGPGLPLLISASAFGSVCRANCAVLRTGDRGCLRVLVASFLVCLVPLYFAQSRAIGFACLLAIAMLFALAQTRDRVLSGLGSITWRALVDAALVAPALAVAVLLWGRAQL